jgi:magnesium chelatase family protein
MFPAVAVSSRIPKSSLDLLFVAPRNRVLKVVRMIADPAGSEEIIGDHANEPIQFRSLDRQLLPDHLAS